MLLLRPLPENAAEAFLDAVENTAESNVQLMAIAPLLRSTGKVERQYRLNIGTLPVAYHSELNGQFLYVLDSAVTSVSGGGSRSTRVPVPPCIRATELGTETEAIIEIDDKVCVQALLQLCDV